MRHERLAPFVIAVTSLIASTVGLSAAEVAFRLEEATIAEIQRAVAAGALSSEKLVELYLARISAYDRAGPRLNSIIYINPNAKVEAAALDKERAEKGPRGPLHGIPVLLKDNIDVANMPTTNGSAVMKDAVPPEDGSITKALRSAGVVIMGKAAMGEFAGGSYNSVRGQTLNPYNVKRATGGSSSGSGAAISANFSVLAVGTDTSTSVRGPASYTGIVGLRPTTGLISRAGIAPKNLNFDSAGPMARNVTDLALMLNVLAFRDPKDLKSVETWDAFEKLDPTAKSGVDFTKALDRDALKGRKLGVLRDLFEGDPEINALAEKAIATMKGLGATIVDIKLDPAFVEAHLKSGIRKTRDLSDYRFRRDWEQYLATFRSSKVPKTVAEFVNIYETEIAPSPLPVEDSVMNLLKKSLKTSTDAPEYRDFMENLMPRATAEKLAVFEKHGVDALVFPYVPTFAQPIKNPVYTIDDPAFVKSDAPVPATMSGYSSVGFPSIVVPMGFGSQGLPMTITFFGKPYDEKRIIGFAYAYEQASKLRKPSPLVPPLTGENVNYAAK
jgi:Asp-tRNA(Asn)/Glu-tRNA(Gln) amidotransferase A subunit family amidase